MEIGEIYLIPTTLGTGAELGFLPPYIIDLIADISYYFVENERSARRFLKKIGLKEELDDLIFFPLNSKEELENVNDYLAPIFEGKNIGVIPEVGCPGIADVGAYIVQLAHEKGIKVNPLIGPSCIMLALMASGFNGQKFSFNGYLPRNKKERIASLKKFERVFESTGQTQIFIETPFRNMHLLDDIVKNCSPNLRLCVATNITLPGEFIQSQTIRDWQVNLPNIHKKPSVFLFGK